MMLNRFTKICFTLAVIYSSNFSHASVSKQMALVGKIISFDQTYVRVKSGDQEYIFSKEDLDHPSYSVGDRIEIPFDINKMKQAKVKRIKSGKNTPSIGRTNFPSEPKLVLICKSDREISAKPW